MATGVRFESCMAAAAAALTKTFQLQQDDDGLTVSISETFERVDEMAAYARCLSLSKRKKEQVERNNDTDTII